MNKKIYEAPELIELAFEEDVISTSVVTETDVSWDSTWDVEW